MNRVLKKNNYQNFYSLKRSISSHDFIIILHYNYLNSKELLILSSFFKEEGMKSMKIKLNLFRKLVNDSNILPLLNGPTLLLMGNDLNSCLSILKNKKIQKVIFLGVLFKNSYFSRKEFLKSVVGSNSLSKVLIPSMKILGLIKYLSIRILRLGQIQK